jgi:hypothetical protein
MWRQISIKEIKSSEIRLALGKVIQGTSFNASGVSLVILIGNQTPNTYIVMWIEEQIAFHKSS